MAGELAHRKPVLIIEADKIVRRLLKCTLNSHGYAPIEAKGGIEGLHRIPALRPILIILELDLPDMDGLKVNKQVRRWGDTPIIVLSAREQG